jgi:membrane-bound ClpP family serine protease
MRDKRVLILAFIVLFTFAFINDSFGQNIKSSADYIYVIPVKGVINRGLAAFVTRMIGEAEESTGKSINF